MDKIVIIIPARGGSKRIPNKNLRPLAGRSLIAHTLEAIDGSGVSAPVILSTDSEAIADEGRRLGLPVPFIRPAHMANDTASTVDAVLHAIDWFCDDTGTVPDAVMVLQPTSPLRGSACLRNAIALLRRHKFANSVVSMSELHISPANLFLADSKGAAQRISDETDHPVLVPNGAIYLTRTYALRDQNSVYVDPILPLPMDSLRSVDVDTPADWDVAAALLACGFPSIDQGEIHF